MQLERCNELVYQFRLAFREGKCLLVLVLTVLAYGAISSHALAQEMKLLEDVERNVQRLVSRFEEASKRAALTANPLQRQPPDVERFNQELKTELDRLLGQEIVLDTRVAGFSQESDKVLISFMDADWMKDPILAARSLRFRLQGDQAASIYFQTAELQAREQGETNRLEQFIFLGMFQPDLKTLSRISVIGEVGQNVERYIAEGFEVGDKYNCRLRITGYSSSWGRESNTEQRGLLDLFGGMGPYLEALRVENPELARLIEATNQPYIEITCEWVRNAADVQIGDLDITIQGNPRDHVAIAARGQLRQSIGDFANSINDFDKAIAIVPTNSVYWFNRATAKVELTDPSAVEDFRKSLELDPNQPKALQRLGLALLRLGKYEEAIAAANQADEMTPNQPEVLDVRAVGSMLIKNYPDAIRDFSQILDKHSGNAETQALRGWAYVLDGDYDAAIRDFEASSQTQPRPIRADFGWAFLKASAPREKDRDGRAAAALIKPHMESVGDRTADQLAVAAAVHAELGEFDKAVELVTRAIERSATEPMRMISFSDELWERLAQYQNRQPYRLPSAANQSAAKSADLSANITQSSPNNPTSEKNEPFFLGKWKINWEAMEPEFEREIKNKIPPEQQEISREATKSMQYQFSADGTATMMVDVFGNTIEYQGTWKVIERTGDEKMIAEVRFEEAIGWNPRVEVLRKSDGNIVLNAEDGPALVLTPNGPEDQKPLKRSKAKSSGADF